MQINKLRLKGFIGIQKGMGKDEVEIDFSNLTGLVAIAGPNGNGKTTILDSMTPFRTLASRKRSLQHHVFLRDSEKDLEFDFNGDRYRSLVKIDSESERTEAYLWKNGESLVDGKVTNYDKEIQGLFGSPALFFNSVFCAQNSEKINEMTTGELKKLFSEFLRLDQLVDYENTSKQCAIILSNKLDALETEIDQLTQKTRDKEDIVLKLASSKTQLEMATQNIKRLEGERDAKQDELSKAQAAVQKNEMLREREKELKAECDAIVKEIDEFDKNIQYASYEKSREYHKAGVDIALQDSLLANEREIREAVKQVDKLKTEFKDTQILGEKERIRETQLREKYEKISDEAGKKSVALLNFQAETRNTENKIKIDIENCKTRKAELEKKDPDCTSTTCSFIVGALEAERQLPKLEKNISDWQIARRIKEEELTRESDRLKGEVVDLQAQIKVTIVNINGLRDTYRELKKKVKELEPLANDLPKVEIATERRADLIKKQKELEEQEQKIRSDGRIRRKEMEEKQLSAITKLNTIQKQIDIGVNEKIVNIQKRSNELTTQITQLDQLIPSYKADIATHERRLEEIEKAENDYERAKIQADRWKTEISEWTYLKNACSKDGLRALEIDSVAPVVTGYANELLTSTFGPASTIRFRTQDEETGSEILDILVIREDGPEVLLDNLSGGEKVWNLKALRLAMTLVSKEKSGINFLTALADEEDGALDIENAQNFVGLYRSFMKSGGFDTCFYISHKPDCVAMADHVISLNGNGIEII